MNGRRERSERQSHKEEDSEGVSGTGMGHGSPMEEGLYLDMCVTLPPQVLSYATADGASVPT